MFPLVRANETVRERRLILRIDDVAAETRAGTAVRSRERAKERRERLGVPPTPVVAALVLSAVLVPGVVCARTRVPRVRRRRRLQFAHHRIRQTGQRDGVPSFAVGVGEARGGADVLPGHAVP